MSSQEPDRRHACHRGIGERQGTEPDLCPRGLSREIGRLPESADRRPLQVIQAGRGIAALLVVLFHATSIAEFYLHHDFAAGLFVFGYGGVDVFFVLSGLVIVWAHGHELGHPDRLRPYLIRRFIRIYPVFWIVAAILTPIYFGVPRQPSDLVTLFRAFLLLNPIDNPVVTVAWSLTHEIYFYAVFGVVIALPWRLAGNLISIWLSLSAASYLATIVTSGRLHVPPWAGFWLSPYNLEFAMGCATAYALRVRAVDRRRLLAPIGAAIIVVSGLNEQILHRHFGQRHSIVCYGFATMLLVWGAVQWEQRTNRQIARPLLVLGDASYSIYLTHYALLDLLAKASLASGLAAVLRPSLTIALLIALTVGIGIAFHQRIERPLLSRLRHHRPILDTIS